MVNVGMWLTLPNGRKGQVWAQAPARSSDQLNGWWVAVNDDEGAAFIELDFFGTPVPVL